MGSVRNVKAPTLTRLGTVVVPLQAPDGQKIVVELTRTMWRSLRGNVDEQFARLDRQVETGKAILDIERHESVVG